MKELKHQLTNTTQAIEAPTNEESVPLTDVLEKIYREISTQEGQRDKGLLAINRKKEEPAWSSKEV